MAFLRQCIAKFRDVNFADQATGRIYLVSPGSVRATGSRNGRAPIRIRAAVGDRAGARPRWTAATGEPPIWPRSCSASDPNSVAGVSPAAK
jgi:hypothetical protein